MVQVLEVLGAVAILAPFVLAQVAGLSVRSYPYLLLNFAGSAVLAGIAAHDARWGFLLLEGVWAVVSLAGIVGRLRGGPAGGYG